jgi:4-nitrophenyl phosphatase
LNLEKLTQVGCFVLDMDGTFYLDDRLLPGALEFLRLLEGRGTPYLFLTNNSSRRREQYAEKLNRLGAPVRPDQIFTSGEATALYLKQRKPGARLFVCGTPALEDEFHSHGFELVQNDPDFVVLGFDTTLTYAKLWKLCDLVRAGLPYIATHPDFNCPVEGGFMPDIGAMIAFVAASTGRQPGVIIGKPYHPIVDALAERIGLPVGRLAMVGDRLYTDIALGEAGLVTVLVLSGETQPQDVRDSPHQPDYIMRDLAELCEWVEKIVI